MDYFPLAPKGSRGGFRFAGMPLLGFGDRSGGIDQSTVWQRVWFGLRALGCRVILNRLMKFNWSIAAAAVFLIAMTRTTVANGLDFEVYWRTVHAVFSGDPIYSLQREGNMVFKYPPWILPLFLPFAVLPLYWAKAAWGVFQGVALILVVRRLHVAKVSQRVLLGVFLSFAGIWTNHAYLGQVALPMLAAAVCLDKVFLEGSRGTRFQLLIWSLSTKILSLFPVLGFQWKRRDLRPILITAVIFAGLTLPFIIATGNGPFEILHSWTHSATSGATPIAGVHVTVAGREAQGFPSFIFRVFHLNENNIPLVLLVCSFCAGVLATFWRWAQSRLEPNESWAGWLALTATVQPLAGYYSFCLAFPLAVYAMDRAVRSRRVLQISLPVLGITMICALTRKTLGDEAGRFVETISIKSWGVLFCAGTLLFKS